MCHDNRLEPLATHLLFQCSGDHKFRELLERIEQAEREQTSEVRLTVSSPPAE